MKINADQSEAAPVEPASSPVTQAKNDRVSTTSQIASTTENAPTTFGAAPATPVQRDTDVTFRRDDNGRIYYVISDAQSGEEIIEVPAKAVRNVSQGIEDYLKQQESKSSSHVKTKA